LQLALSSDEVIPWITSSVYYLASISVLSFLVTHKSFSFYHNPLSFFLFPVFYKLLCLQSPHGTGSAARRKFSWLRPLQKGRNGGQPLEPKKEKKMLLTSDPFETFSFSLILAVGLLVCFEHLMIQLPAFSN